MQRKISLPAAIVLILLAALLTFQITYVTMVNRYKNEVQMLTASQSAYEKLNYVDALYRSYYVGDIDEEELSDYLIRGYIAGVGDKYASYMTADEFSAYMQESSGEMVGIGIHIIYNNELGALEVISVMRDSPALEAGVEPGDLIVMVGDEYVSDLGYYPAVDKMLGDLGSVAQFTVRRGKNYEEIKEFSIIREKVTDTTVETNLYGGDIGIIRITQFAENTGESVKTAIADLTAKGAKSLIFDVRYNPGGALTGIVDTLDFLLPEGPIIRIVDKEGNVESIDSDAACFEIPMAILVNESTASAAELFTSALQDYELATVIGTTTYGKGTMQTVVSLPDGSGLSISYRMYNPPYSDNYEGIGVVPDIELPLEDALLEKNFYKITYDEDNQLQTAVKILRGELTVAQANAGK
ncbi:MAG: S41 family peptidase [Ruminococcaceae bacterium]|nr:S41 family peptidase [Oscillospiraceae bacterium]